MSDMKISVWFRWKTGTYLLAFSFFNILIYDLLDKISGNCFVIHSLDLLLFFSIP